MPNAITLAQQFVPLLDETYQLASLTADLDGNADLEMCIRDSLETRVLFRARKEVKP